MIGRFLLSSSVLFCRQSPRLFVGHSSRSFAIQSTMKKATVVAVVQLNCKSNKDDNFSRAKEIICRARDAGAEMAFLPECFDMVCESREETLSNLEPIDGPLISKYKQLAREKKVWLSLGGFHEQVTGEVKAKNAHIIINSDGNIVDVYRKVHLFNLEVPGVVRLIESEFSIAGDKLVGPVDTIAGRIGLGICYDVRFAEFSIAYAQAGADILTFPSAFTVPTGMDHWSTLLRCRAIENQSYVIAAAQTGVHNKKRSSYGHAMVVDPWGAIIAQCSEGEGFALAIIDPQVLKTSRSKLPIWTDRRTDIYGKIIGPLESFNNIEDQQEYIFGQARVKNFQVFWKTRLTYAFVNHRPVLPGHVIIAPLRPEAKRLNDLTRDELTDFFAVVQRVQKVVETVYETDSSTVAIQDGVHAGQSIDHLHCHILPRKATDFGGNIDDIYRQLQTHDKEKEGKKVAPLQTPEQMTETSKLLRKHFI